MDVPTPASAIASGLSHRPSHHCDVNDETDAHNSDPLANTANQSVTLPAHPAGEISPVLYKIGLGASEEYHPPQGTNAFWHKVYRDNQRIAKMTQDRDWATLLQQVPSGFQPHPLVIEEFPFYQHNVEVNQRLGPLIAKHLASQRRVVQQKELRLKRQYRYLYHTWQQTLQKGRKTVTEKATQDNDGTAEEPQGDGQLHLRTTTTVTRQQRRQDSSGGVFFGSDAVRSEAELLEIIQSLEYQEMRNPDVRSSRTAAVIPNMILDPEERKRTLYDNSNGLVHGPVTYYNINRPLGESSSGPWKRSQSDMFIRKYLTYPKRFGKIASFVPGKSVTQCVLFYYRTKKVFRYKFLLTSHGRSEFRQARRLGLGLSQAAYLVGQFSNQGKRMREFGPKSEVTNLDFTELDELLGYPGEEPDISQLLVGPPVLVTPEPAETVSEPTPPVINTRRTRSRMGSIADMTKSTPGEKPPTDTDDGIGLGTPCPECQTTHVLAVGCPGSRARGRNRQRRIVSATITPTTVAGSAPLRRRASSRSIGDVTPVSKKPPESRPRGAKRVQVSNSVSPRDLSDRVSSPLLSDAALSSPPPPGSGSSTAIARWSDTDRILAVEGYRRFGRDFEAVSQLVRTKTEDQCRNFYHNYRRKYGADAFRNPPEWFSEKKLRTAQLEVARYPHMAPIEPIPEEKLVPGSLTTTEVESKEAIAPETTVTSERLPATRSSSPVNALLKISRLLLNDDINSTESAIVPQSEGLTPQPIVSHPAPLPTAVQETPPMEMPVPDPSIVAPPSTVRKPHYSSYWSVAEKSSFLTYLAQVGKQWDQIATLLKTKTAIQVRNYFQNNQERLKLDKIVDEWSRKQAVLVEAPVVNATQPVVNTRVESRGYGFNTLASHLDRPSRITTQSCRQDGRVEGHTSFARPGIPIVTSSVVNTGLVNTMDNNFSPLRTPSTVPSYPDPILTPTRTGSASTTTGSRVTKIDALLNDTTDADTTPDWTQGPLVDWFSAPVRTEEPRTAVETSITQRSSLVLTNELRRPHPILPDVEPAIPIAALPSPTLSLRSTSSTRANRLPSSFIPGYPSHRSSSPPHRLEQVSSAHAPSAFTTVTNHTRPSTPGAPYSGVGGHSLDPYLINRPLSSSATPPLPTGYTLGGSHGHHPPLIARRVSLGRTITNTDGHSPGRSYYPSGDLSGPVPAPPTPGMFPPGPNRNIMSTVIPHHPNPPEPVYNYPIMGQFSPSNVPRYPGTPPGSRRESLTAVPSRSLHGVSNGQPPSLVPNPGHPPPPTYSSASDVFASQGPPSVGYPYPYAIPAVNPPPSAYNPSTAVSTTYRPALHQEYLPHAHPEDNVSPGYPYPTSKSDPSNPYDCYSRPSTPSSYPPPHYSGIPQPSPSGPLPPVSSSYPHYPSSSSGGPPQRPHPR
ncbi:DNA-binding protein snt1 [Dispira simplex]|nr:DNA-binding protein snt1 [Dispira simplex]